LAAKPQQCDDDHNFIAQTCAHDEAARLQVKQLGQRKVRAFGNWVEKWKELIHG